jgi:hypothetical protein
MVDPELNLKIEEGGCERIYFYGYDEKNRKIDVIGYGVFE